MTHKPAAGMLAVSLSSEAPSHVTFEMIRELGGGINVKYQAQEHLVKLEDPKPLEMNCKLWIRITVV